MPPPMAPPPMYGPPPMMGMPMDSPNVSRAKLGLLLVGIGLILYSFLQFLAYLNIVSYLLVVIGAVMAWMGASKAWPTAKMTVMAGFALILVGLIVWIVAQVTLPVLGVSYTTNYLNAYATYILVGFVASLLTWIGVILLPLKITAGAGKALTIVGGVLGLVGSLLVFGLVYFGILGLVSQGGAITSSQFLTIVGGLILGGVLGLVGGILAGVGYIVGRGKMPAAMA